MHNKLIHFHEAQSQMFAIAFNEIKKGKKKSHWMWFIFPQLKDLGNSPKSRYFGLNNLEIAELYLNDSILGNRLITICNELLKHSNKSAFEVFGSPDDLKLKSCMTLFAQCENTNEIFKEVLNVFYQGEVCQLTINLLKK